MILIAIAIVLVVAVVFGVILLVKERSVRKERRRLQSALSARREERYAWTSRSATLAPIRSPVGTQSDSCSDTVTTILLMNALTDEPRHSAPIHDPTHDPTSSSHDSSSNYDSGSSSHDSGSWDIWGDD